MTRQLCEMNSLNSRAIARLFFYARLSAPFQVCDERYGKTIELRFSK